jgi:hypothetical protein
MTTATTLGREIRWPFRGPADPVRVPEDVVKTLVTTLSDTAAVEVLDRYMRIKHGRGERGAIVYLRRLLRSGP